MACRTKLTCGVMVVLCIILIMFTSKETLHYVDKLKWNYDVALDTNRAFLQVLWTNESANSQATISRDVKDAYDIDKKISQEQNRSHKILLNEAPIKRLPDGIVIGVSKCGTRALLEYLGLNPFIVTAKQEINFFNEEELYQRGLQWYRDQMPLSYSNQLTIEKSPDLFQCSKCPERVYFMKKDIKLFLLLRDPVERLVSQYMQFVDKYSQSDRQMPPFKEWVISRKTSGVITKVPSVDVGVYAKHLKNWLDIFPRKQIHIIDSQKFTMDPLTELTKAELFLELNPFLSEEDIYYNQTKGFHCLRNRFTGKSRCLGPTKGRPHIEIDSETLNILKKFYSSRNHDLKGLIGYWMSWFE